MAERALGREAGEVSPELTDRLDTMKLPERELRVGLRLRESDSTAIVEAPGFENVRWFNVPEKESDEQACDRYTLDAIINRSGRLVRITTLRRASRDVGWTDWGLERELAYASVFPARLDCGSTTLLEPEDDQPMRWDLVRLVAEAASVLSRHPARLTPSDRFRGRRPFVVAPKRSDRFSEFRPVRDRGRDMIERLADLAVGSQQRSTPAPAERVIARVASAYAATAGKHLDDRRRRAIADGAVRIAGDEPEVMLRYAAVRFGSGDDAAGMDGLLRADRMLRLRRTMQGIDHVAFLQSELESGPDDVLAVGRVAAGICMVCAALPPARIAYLRDDLLDDMRYAGLLVGRDQDRRLLAEVFRALEGARRAESHSLPSRVAA